MARRVQDREDLLREATALEPRMSLKTDYAPLAGEVFLGFRGRSLSLYFGSEPVFHFNPVGQLRRAFYQGHILKAECGMLVRWETERTEEQTIHHSTPLDEVELYNLRQEMLKYVEALKQVLAKDDYELVGEVPEDGTTVVCWNAWLRGWQGFEIADAPHVGEVLA